MPIKIREHFVTEPQALGPSPFFSSFVHFVHGDAKVDFRSWDRLMSVTDTMQVTTISLLNLNICSIRPSSFVQVLSLGGLRNLHVEKVPHALRSTGQQFSASLPGLRFRGHSPCDFGYGSV